MIRSELMAKFVLIVDCGSLNAAAGRLRLSRSVVSDRLNALEADVGTQLITRSTHGLSLTRAGEVFLRHAREIATAMEVARNDVASAGGEISGSLRIAAPAALTGDWLVPVFNDFLQENPLVSIELSVSDRSVDIVQDGFDLAIRGGNLSDSALLARKITSSHRVVVCSPDYRDRRGVPSSPADLAGHECIGYRNRRVTQDWTFRTAKGIRSEWVTGRFQADDGVTLGRAAVAGAGIVLVPTFIVSRDLLAGRLITIDLGAEVESISVSAVYPAANAGLPRLQALIDHLRKALGDPPSWDLALADAGLIQL